MRLAPATERWLITLPDGTCFVPRHCANDLKLDAKIAAYGVMHGYRVELITEDQAPQPDQQTGARRSRPEQLSLHP